MSQIFTDEDQRWVDEAMKLAPAAIDYRELLIKILARVDIYDALGPWLTAAEMAELNRLWDCLKSPPA